MRNKKKVSIILLVVAILGVIVFNSANHTILKMRIKYNLWERHGINITYQSFVVRGDAVYFECSSRNSPSVVFSGMANKGSGSIVYENYIGSIIGESDASFLEDCLGSNYKCIYVYGAPSLKMWHGSWDDYLAKGYKNGELSLEDLHHYMYPISLLFYIYFDVSDDSYVYDPEMEYISLEYSINELISKYKNEYDQDIFVDMHIYFVDKEKIDFSKQYFDIHTLADYEYNENVSPGNRIIMEMGVENGFASSNLRLTSEDYCTERERIREWQSK